MEEDGGGGGEIENERADFRTASELRAVACERGVLTRADGSVQWSQGQSSVMVAVFGPTGTSDTQACQQGILDVCFKGRQLAGGRDKEMEFKLRESMKSSILLTLVPQTITRLVIQVLKEDGGLLACAFNASCAALIDAGVSLKNMWVSVACAITSDGNILVDPDDFEEKNSRSVVCATFPCVRQQNDELEWITSVAPEPMCCDSWGQLEVDTFFKTIDVCRKGGIHVADFNVLSLRKRLDWD